jgi:hypothetical protein
VFRKQLNYVSLEARTVLERRGMMPGYIEPADQRTRARAEENLKGPFLSSFCTIESK